VFDLDCCAADAAHLKSSQAGMCWLDPSQGFCRCCELWVDSFIFLYCDNNPINFSEDFVLALH
jgi:hypothetical protein